jgi:hypothetical protein
MSEVEALLRDGVLVMDDVFGACHAVELSDALQKLYEAGRLPRGEIGRSAAKQRSSPRRARFDHLAVSTNRPRGGENPLTTGVKSKASCVPGPTAPVAWPGYLSVSTE